MIADLIPSRGKLKCDLFEKITDTEENGFYTCENKLYRPLNRSASTLKEDVANGWI